MKLDPAEIKEVTWKNTTLVQQLKDLTIAKT